MFQGFFNRWYTLKSIPEDWPVATSFFSSGPHVGIAMQRFPCLPWQPDLYKTNNTTKTEKESGDIEACLIVWMPEYIDKRSNTQSLTN